jgi:hypothetical protein
MKAMAEDTLVEEISLQKRDEVVALERLWRGDIAIASSFGLRCGLGKAVRCFAASFGHR